MLIRFWRNSVSAILPDPTASLSENTKPEEEKLSDQEMFSPEISIGNVASVQDKLPNPEPSPNRVPAYTDVTPSEGVKTTPSTALFSKRLFQLRISIYSTVNKNQPWFARGKRYVEGAEECKPGCVHRTTMHSSGTDQHSCWQYVKTPNLVKHHLHLKKKIMASIFCIDPSSCFANSSPTGRWRVTVQSRIQSMLE